MIDFDDSRLEDAKVLQENDHWIRPLAEAGARLRREALHIEKQLSALAPEPLPRAIIAFGSEARLVRAAVEPSCPVPFVAWPRLRLPAWVGPLDLVVTLGASDQVLLDATAEAVRRGARVLVASPPDSELARKAASRNTTLLPTCADLLTCAILVLAGLQSMGIGATLDIEAVADAMDLVASECSPRRDGAVNPAKRIAMELAEAQPLVWGGSILAARASRRIAEALRSGSGRVCLAADSDEMLTLLSEVKVRDVFADPFEELLDSRPGLVVLDDDFGDANSQQEQQRLISEATRRDVLVSQINCTAGDRLTRYVTLIQQGFFAAAYLRIGLSRG
ncbi:MAG: hypothetical protein FWG47_02365 [Propionibacteriaceae bacterium]|nr:hypothetical protein [Propionibacteriaceae bacterium]